MAKRASSPDPQLDIEDMLAGRSLAPIETRDDRTPAPTPAPDQPDLTAATRAVEALRGDVETFRRQTDERLAGELRGITERLDAIEVRSQRPSTPAAPTQANDAEALARRAFTGYLRRGREVLAPEEVRALAVSPDTAGGYLAPAQFVAEVVRGIVERSPIRQAARVGRMSGSEVILPKRTGTPTAQWVGETADRPETGPTYGQVTIPAHESACYVDVSQRLLEDAAVNVDAEVAFDLAEEFGRLEGAAFMTGDGVAKPSGLMVNGDVDYTPTGNASTLGSDPAGALIDLFYAVPAFYRNRGVWMMNGSTLAAVRKLKDAGTGAFLWQPALTAGQPETLLGRPVIEDPTMEDVGSAAEPVVFGDFSSGYRVYDRVDLSILRDPYSVAAKGLVRFHARRRVGGDVTLAEAFRKLRCATS